MLEFFVEGNVVAREVPKIASARFPAKIRSTDTEKVENRCKADIILPSCWNKLLGIQWQWDFWMHTYCGGNYFAWGIEVAWAVCMRLRFGFEIIQPRFITSFASNQKLMGRSYTFLQ